MTTATVAATAKENLIGLEPLEEICETAIFSSHLTDTIPISVMLIGPSGAGKSKLIMQYQNANGCHITSDVTSMGLQELMQLDHKGEVKFIIIPDFNLVLSHRASTLQLVIANLLSLTSEGTIRIDDGRVRKETKHAPVGIITAMTRELYRHVAKKWSVLGFNRRFLPIFYDYSVETRMRIQNSIVNGTTTLLQLAERKLNVPPKPSDVSVSQVGKDIQMLSDELATNIGYLPAQSRDKAKEENNNHRKGVMFIGKQLEFSPHLSLRSMARAHALRDGRNKVQDQDVKFLMRLLTFTRYDRPGSL